MIPGFVAVIVGAGGRCESVFGDPFLKESSVVSGDAWIVGFNAVHPRCDEESPIADRQVRRWMGQNRLAAGRMNERDRVGNVQWIVVDVAVNEVVQVAFERVLDRRRVASGDEFAGQMPMPRRLPVADPFKAPRIEANLLLEDRGGHRRPSRSSLLLSPSDRVNKSLMMRIESVPQQMKRSLAMRHGQFDAAEKLNACRVSRCFEVGCVVNHVMIAGNDGRQPAAAGEVRQLAKRQRAVAGDAVDVSIHQRVVGKINLRPAQWLNRNSLLLKTPQ